MSDLQSFGLSSFAVFVKLDPLELEMLENSVFGDRCLRRISDIQ